MASGNTPSHRGGWSAHFGSTGGRASGGGVVKEPTLWLRKCQLMDLAAESIDLPAESIDLPAESIDLPAESIDLPAESIDLPAGNIDLPAGNIDLGRKAALEAPIVVGAMTNVDVVPQGCNRWVAAANRITWRRRPSSEQKRPARCSDR